MNIEVEIKIKVDGLDKPKEELLKLGKLVKSIRQIDDYYVPCQRDFFSRKPHPTEWLRIRTNPDKVIFEYDRSINKKADGSQDCAEEYETEISSPEELRKILGFLDFKKIVTVDKQRQYWDCGDFEIVLDEIAKLGYFIEVERKGEFNDTAKARGECIKFLEKLGIKANENDLLKAGYPVMLLEKK